MKKAKFILLIMVVIVSACSENDNNPIVDSDKDSSQVEDKDVNDSSGNGEDNNNGSDDYHTDENSSVNDIENDYMVDDKDDEPVDDDVADPIFPDEIVSGRVNITATGYVGNFSDPYVSADFFDQPVRMDAFAATYPEDHELVKEEGSCRVYKAVEYFCNPPCDYDEHCKSGNKCEQMYKRLSAGTVTFSAEGKTVEINSADYGYDSIPFPKDQFKKGIEITASAAGDEFPAFNIKIEGVEPFETSIVKDNFVKLSDDNDAVITWTSEGSGKVKIVFNFGWHGAPPEAIVVCETEGDNGSITIPKSIIKECPYNSEMGLEPHMSFIEIVNRTAQNTNGGVVEFFTSYRQIVYPLHED